jgi:tyrosine-protein phosphatase non-receptor type 12/18/22
MTHLFTVDYTRVILSSVPGIIGSDYVNANFIKGASGSLAYIASQGPLPHTASDFWRMVIECEVQVIVMACNEEESGKVQTNTFAECRINIICPNLQHKCENYWVDREGDEKQFGMATIRLIKASVVSTDFLVRTMLLTYRKNNVLVG